MQEQVSNAELKSYHFETMREKEKESAKKGDGLLVVRDLDHATERVHHLFIDRLRKSGVGPS